MKKEIPEIEDLLQGIQGQEIGKSTPSEANVTPETNPPTATEAVNEEPDEKLWKNFLEKLNNPDMQQDKDDRLVCKLDRDLADSLDDCDIGNKCRSDLVNAIIRAFFSTYMNRLVSYRREKKSLFKNYNQDRYERNQMD